jgi:hypothetical protein
VKGEIEIMNRVEATWKVLLLFKKGALIETKIVF